MVSDLGKVGQWNGSATIGAHTITNTTPLFGVANGLTGWSESFAGDGKTLNAVLSSNNTPNAAWAVGDGGTVKNSTDGNNGSLVPLPPLSVVPSASRRDGR